MGDVQLKVCALAVDPTRQHHDRVAVEQGLDVSFEAVVPGRSWIRAELDRVHHVIAKGSKARGLGVE